MDYEIETKKENYLPAFAKRTTVGILKSQTINLGNEFGLVDTREPINLPHIEYEISSWVLKPESEKALMVLIETLNRYPELSVVSK